MSLRSLWAWLSPEARKCAGLFTSPSPLARRSLVGKYLLLSVLIVSLSDVATHLAFIYNLNVHTKKSYPQKVIFITFWASSVYFINVPVYQIRYGMLLRFLRYALPYGQSIGTCLQIGKVASKCLLPPSSGSNLRIAQGQKF